MPIDGAERTCGEKQILSGFSRYMAALAIIGFGCYITCGIVELNPSIYVQPSSQAGDLIRSLALFKWAIGLAVPLFLACVALRFGSLYCRKRIVLFLGCSYSLGTALVLFGGYTSTFIPPMVVAGTLLQGVSTGFIVLWLDLLCATDTRHIALITAAAYTFAFLLGLVLSELRCEMLFIAITVLPVVSSAVLFLFSDEVTECPSSRGDYSLKSIPVLPLLAIGVFGFAQLLANSVSELRIQYSTEVYTLFAGAIAALLVAFVLTTMKKRFDFVVLLRFAMPIIVLALLVVLVAESGGQIYEAFALGACYAFFRIFVATFWCNLAMNSTLASGCVIGIAQAILSVCDKVEKPAFWLIQQFSMSDTLTIAVVIAAVILASTCLVHERDFVRSEKPDGDTIIAFANLDDFYDECVMRGAEEYRLTQREQDICRLVLRGRSSDEVREQLFIAPGTFKTHMRNIYGKMDVHSRQEMVTKLRNETMKQADSPQ